MNRPSLAGFTIILALAVTHLHAEEIEMNRYINLFANLSTNPPRHPEALGRALGIGLTPDRIDAARDWLVENVVSVEGLEYSYVEMRFSTNVTIIAIRIPPNGAPTRREIFKRFDNLRLEGAPTGRSLDEEAVWGRDEVWGHLSFGFSERNPDKLRTVALKLPVL